MIHDLENTGAGDLIFTTIEYLGGANAPLPLDDGPSRRMKPAPFDYHAPETIEEALALLARGDDVRVLAGGQSLVPLMKLRAVKPRCSST